MAAAAEAEPAVTVTDALTTVRGLSSQTASPATTTKKPDTGIIGRSRSWCRTRMIGGLFGRTSFGFSVSSGFSALSRLPARQPVIALPEEEAARLHPCRFIHAHLSSGGVLSSSRATTSLRCSHAGVWRATGWEIVQHFLAQQPGRIRG